MTAPTLDDFEESGEILRAVGPPDHWLTTVNKGIWGFGPDHRDSWERLGKGDIIIFYTRRKDMEGDAHDAGVIGFGVVDHCDEKDGPLWYSEHRDGSNDYPYIVQFSETWWRGDIREIGTDDINEKSRGDIIDEIRSLTRNRLTRDEIEDSLDYQFPYRSSISGITEGEGVLELLRSEPLTNVRYRRSGTTGGGSDARTSPNTADFEPLFGDDIEIDASDLFDGLYFDADERERIRSATVSAVLSGKHVVFTGPPGTGKTELAENLCRALQANEQYTGYRLTTATADWSTFDTVGGYMPREEAGGSLEFKPGQVLKRLPTAEDARNELLVVDEINRADIDKAFGQLFTVLSGQAVQLPFEKDGTEVEIVPGEDVDPTAGPESHEYAVPASWRLFATMNSYDKTSLYEMSYAFMRRFAFVRVGAPTLPEEDETLEDLMVAYDRAWGNDGQDRPERLAVGRVWRAVNGATAERSIGPAIVKDMLEFVRAQPADADDEAFGRYLTEAVLSYVFPQLEGVPKRRVIVESVAEVKEIDENRLMESAREMLQVEPTADG